MCSFPSQTGESLSKVCENSRAGENPRLRVGFSLICSRILPNVRLGFHQAMKAWRTYFISLLLGKCLGHSTLFSYPCHFPCALFQYVAVQAVPYLNNSPSFCSLYLLCWPLKEFWMQLALLTLLQSFLLFLPLHSVKCIIN